MPSCFQRHVVAAGLQHPARMSRMFGSGTQVIVQQLQAVEQPVLAQSVHEFDELRRRQAENAAVAAPIRSSVPRPWRQA